MAGILSGINHATNTACNPNATPFFLSERHRWKLLPSLGFRRFSFKRCFARHMRFFYVSTYGVSRTPREAPNIFCGVAVQARSPWHPICSARVLLPHVSPAGYFALLWRSLPAGNCRSFPHRRGQRGDAARTSTTLTPNPTNTPRPSVDGTSRG